ncbi:IQ motif, EF-hand binding site containing protein [Tanacetum coccineum]
MTPKKTTPTSAAKREAFGVYSEQEYQESEIDHLGKPIAVDAGGSKKYKVDNPWKFHYLNQSSFYDLKGVDESKEYFATNKAMDIVGISSAEQDAIFRVVAASIHLGNIDFTKGSEPDFSQVKDDKSRSHLESVADPFMAFGVYSEREYQESEIDHLGKPIAVDARGSKKYKVDNPGKFHYLNQSSFYDLKGVDESTEYFATNKAMDIVRISSAEQDAIFCVVAASIHLGNIDFTKGSEPDFSQVKDDKSRSHLESAPNPFMCDKTVLEDSFCTCVIVTRGKNIKKCIHSTAVIISRDAFAKMVYTKLFDWGVGYCSFIVFVVVVSVINLPLLLLDDLWFLLSGSDLLFMLKRQS